MATRVTETAQRAWGLCVHLRLCCGVCTKHKYNSVIVNLIWFFYFFIWWWGWGGAGEGQAEICTDIKKGGSFLLLVDSGSPVIHFGGSEVCADFHKWFKWTGCTGEISICKCESCSAPRWPGINTVVEKLLRSPIHTTWRGKKKIIYRYIYIRRKKKITLPWTTQTSSASPACQAAELLLRHNLYFFEQRVLS